MFFSTASWNSGGGGKSTARNKNGDTADLISEIARELCQLSVMGHGTSINVEAGLFIAPEVRAHHYMLRFHSHLALKRREDDTCTGINDDLRMPTKERTGSLLLRTTHVLMQVIQQPPEELDRVSLLLEGILSRTRPSYFLQELMGADLALEQAGVPDLLRQAREALEHFRLFPTKVGKQEIVAQWRYVEEGMDNHVHVVIALDVVQTYIPWYVGFR